MEHDAEMIELEVVDEPDPVIVEKPKIEVEPEKMKPQVASIYDGQLTKVDASPPVGVRIVLWLAFPIGAALSGLGLIFSAQEIPSGIPLLLVGTTVAGTSGYFLWFHNWTSRLPDADTTSTTTAGFGVRF